MENFLFAFKFTFLWHEHNGINATECSNRAFVFEGEEML